MRVNLSESHRNKKNLFNYSVRAPPTRFVRRTSPLENRMFRLLRINIVLAVEILFRLRRRGFIIFRLQKILIQNNRARHDRIVEFFFFFLLLIIKT